MKNGSSGEGSLRETVYKVRGGKTIRPRLWVEGETIVRAEVYGDFFMYPEDAVFDLERALAGSSRGEIRRRVEEFFSRRGDVEVVGATPEDFFNAIYEAYIGGE